MQRLLTQKMIGLLLCSLVLSIPMIAQVLKVQKPVAARQPRIEPPPIAKPFGGEFLEVFEIERGVRHHITDVVQDHAGFLWFSTEGGGLFRYDGHQLKSFLHVPGNPESLPQNWIYDLYVCKEGHVWLSVGEANGLWRINAQTGKLESFPLAPEEGQAYLSDIYSVMEGPQNKLVVNGRDGIFEVDPGTGAFWKWPATETLKELSSSKVLSDSRMLLGAKAGLFLVENGEIIKQYKLPKEQTSSYCKILSDGDEKFWVRVGNGTYIFVLSKEAFFKPNYTVPEDWDSFAMTHLMIDSNDNGWVAIENTGLFRIDSQNRRMVPLYSGDDLVNGDQIDPFARDEERSFSEVSALFEDKSGVVWVGSPRGLEKLRRRLPFDHTGYSNRNPQGLVSPEVRSLFEDHEGTLWVGTRDGLNWREKRSNGKRPDSYGRYQLDSNETNAWVNRVTSITGTPEAGIWFCTPKGVFRFDRDTRTAQQLDLGPLLEQAKEPPRRIEIETLAFDQQGLLWMGGKGMFASYDPAKDVLKSYIHSLSDIPRDQRSLYNFEFGADGVLWIANYGGLYKKLPNSDVLIEAPVIDFLPNWPQNQALFPIDIATDANGKVWFTTMSGLVSWNPAKEEASLYTKEDGLPDNVGFALAPVDEHIWISHPKGLTRYTPQSRQALNYNLYDGLKNRFLWKSGYQGQNGRLYFGGNNGFNEFDPSQLVVNREAPRLVLTGLHLDEKESMPDSRPNNVEEIEVNYTNDFLKIYFSVMDFSIPEKNLYTYRLNSATKKGNWTVPSNENVAYLSHLAPGEYRLEVKGANHEGVWSDQVRTIDIRVLPPWSETPAASALAVLFLILLIAGLYYLRTRQLRARARELEFQVAEQTRSLRLAKEKTEAQAAKLLEMDQLKSQFFSNVSHEFRTPLTLIIGPLESLMSATVVPAEELTRHHSVMLRNARRLLRLINQLLDISKLEAGRMQLLTRPVDSCRFLRPIVFAFQSLADKSQIELSYTCDESLEPLYIDPEKMEKVMFNLLSNAFQFTSAGGRIAIKVSLTELDGVSAVCIEVADTGEGIAKADQALIFDRFRQADGSSTREKEGTGIGLSLVKELVELHQGTISVESDKGEGATFFVKLPCGQAHLHPDQIASHDADFEYDLADEKADIEMAHLNAISTIQRVGLADGACGETILVVDDNADIRQYVRDNLIHDYRIIEAEHGQQGLELAQQVKPDLIVTDVMMPVMDGYEMCRRVRADKALQRTPIIMLTAKATDEMRVEGLEIGADEYLSKPFNVRELQVRVRNLLQIRGQEKQMRQSLEMAHKVQVSMLPLETPKVDGLEIASFSIPAKEVGGDYFDFLAPRNGHQDLGIIIGDVSGKGMSAALYMTMTKGLVQAFGGDCVSPRQTLSLINRQFHRASAANAFLSLSYARIDTQSKKMIFSSAGHNPPILYSPARNVIEMVKCPGMAIGLEPGKLFDRVTEEREVQLDSGDILFFYTDGITEGMNERQEIYGETRLIDLIKAHGTMPASLLLQKLQEEHQHFVNGMEQFDDMTAVVVKIP